MSPLFEQDENTAYEDALRKRNEASARYSLLHQKLMSVSMQLDEAEEEWRDAERDLAQVVGLESKGSLLP